MKKASLFGLALFVVALVAAPALAADDGWISLFNGKDLTGWKANENADDWEVKDGAIHGHGPVSHLYYMEREFENFEYKADVKLAPGSNSGMYFRTNYVEHGFPKIYEAQLNNSHKDPKRTGSLYNFVNVGEQLVPDDTWFTQEVIANGNHIIIKVNSKTVVDFVDEAKTHMKGYFAFQQHDPGSKVQIKNVMVKPLP
jgi:hypothetical protein